MQHPASKNQNTLLPQAVMRPIEGLQRYKNNARTHSPEQIRKIANSIRTFGFVEPVLIDTNDILIAGHGRVEGAKLLGMKTIPALCIEHLTQDQVRAYRIAANRLAELAGWDNDLLKIELGDLIEHNFDVVNTGFETPEIDFYVHAGDEAESNSPDDVIPEADPGAPIITKPGDLWILDQHRLLCSDALSADAFDALMSNDRAQMVITDPPYNVPITGHVCGNGSIKHENFVMASGEMSEKEFAAFLGTVIERLCSHTTEGSIHFYFIDWRHIGELCLAAHSHLGKPKNLIVWAKSNGGMGTFYRSQHELIPVFKKGTAAHINNFKLGQHGRYRSNVWTYPGVNTFGKDRLQELAMHPTVKPVAMIADALLDCSNINGIVLDCFAGSGTIFVAAEKTKRRAFAMEIEPKYVDASIRRWEAFTGKTTKHAETGRTFSETAEARHG